MSDVSPSTYEVTLLHVGEPYYIDRTFTITAMPAVLEGLVAIKTANNDRSNQSAAFLSFTLAQDATLYIAYDSRARRYPSWLRQSYSQTGQTINTTDVPLTVWQRPVSAGPVSVPGNQFGNPRRVRSNYLVLLALDNPGGGASWVWEQASIQALPVIFLEAGGHTLTLTQRESGTQLDQLLVTNELEFIP